MSRIRTCTFILDEADETFLQRAPLRKLVDESNRRYSLSFSSKRVLLVLRMLSGDAQICLLDSRAGRAAKLASLRVALLFRVIQIRIEN